MKELNKKLSIITRVVVHPKYNPFAEKAGMQKIAQQSPPREAVKIAETLRQLGFSTQLLGSEKYALSKLQALGEKGVAKIIEAFIRNSHARFMEYFFPISYLEKGKPTQKK